MRDFLVKFKFYLHFGRQAKKIRDEYSSQKHFTIAHIYIFSDLWAAKKHLKREKGFVWLKLEHKRIKNEN